MTIISHQQQKRKKSTYVQMSTFSVAENIRNQQDGENGLQSKITPRSSMESVRNIHLSHNL
jgi:hypothetical protein